MFSAVRVTMTKIGDLHCCSFSLIGSTDGRIHVWRTTDGEKLTVFATDNAADCIQCVQFNPKSFMLASASSNMVGDRVYLQELNVLSLSLSV